MGLLQIKPATRVRNERQKSTFLKMPEVIKNSLNNK